MRMPFAPEMLLWDSWDILANVGEGQQIQPITNLKRNKFRIQRERPWLYAAPDERFWLSAAVWSRNPLTLHP